MRKNLSAKAGLEIQQDCDVVCSLLLRKDDRGIEGVVVLPDNKRRKVRVGTQLSASTVKQREHEDKESMQSMQNKDAAGLMIKTNTKVGKRAFQCCFRIAVLGCRLTVS